MGHLLLQILGNSDVSLGNDKGAELLRGSNLKEVQDYINQITDEVKSNVLTIDFPLIRQVRDALTEIDDLYFVFILTAQRKWIEAQNIYGKQWNQIISSDGIWWRELLEQWCDRANIKHFIVPLEVDADVQNGVADWEGMARLVEKTLPIYIRETTDKSYFLPENSSTEIEIDRIIVQHSSGTPALGSALYLWGIERKLSGLPIEFFYITRQNERGYRHSGDHWQWRLKVPQIQQLLEIQDFNGVLALLDSDRKEITKKVRKLDRAVSFNIRNLGLQPREKVIERIAISLWSEKAFRQRGQWMQWYLRVAGAFELVLYCSVEKQGNGNYQWKNEPTGKTYLKYKTNSTAIEFRLYITPTIKHLLERGSYRDNRGIDYSVTPIASSPQWQNFVDFYCNNGWRLSANHRYSFLDLRNDLYHSLQGDIIDEILDRKNEELKSATHPDHPAEVAIEHLRYTIELAGLLDEVLERVSHYEAMVREVKENLESHTTPRE